MDDASWRSLFRTAAGSSPGSIGMSPALARHIHEAVEETKSLSGAAAYQPKCFTPRFFATVKRPGDIVIPADDHSGGASEAGAAEFIDLLSSRNPELANLFNGGVTWLDQITRQSFGTDFLGTYPEQQTAILDSIAWGENWTPETAYGLQFRTLLRNMVVDAFYTSPVRVRDSGCLGNAVASR